MFQDETTKVCDACHQVKPLAEFYKDRTRKGGYEYCCKRCRKQRGAKYYEANKTKAAARARARRKANPNKLRDESYRYSFGISLEQYNLILAAQNGVCKICSGIGSDGRALAVDHCHTTGIIRGLLCGECNKALGLLKDSPILLHKAITYLLSSAKETKQCLAQSQIM